MRGLDRVVLVVFMSFLFSTAAAKQIGLFMVVKGEVKVVRGSETLKAKVTLGVYQGDTVISGKDARAKIVMTDKNVIHISPSTEIKIETYVNNGQQKNVELNLKEGKVRNNVEQTYDGDKNKFIIKTPTAVAGVRGTQFITSFDKGRNETKIVTLQGRVELSNLPTQAGAQPTTVVINKGETSTASAEAPPAPPQSVPADQMKNIDQDTTVKTTDKKSPSATESNGRASDTKKAPEARVEDPQDQSPKTFDKLPEVKNPTPATAATPPPAFQRPPPPINNLPADAIRQQNEKTKVKIEIKQNTTSP
jgi:hypothetical protein